MSDHAQENIAIFPAMPTPNGSLHLGHIGGPYLRADMLARHLKILGKRVAVCSGSDSYESYVLQTAALEHRSAQEVACDYHRQIETDLKHMRIDMDVYINPMDVRHQTGYEKWHRYLLNLAEKNQSILNLQETIFWDDKNEHYLAGCWLKGKCPYCNRAVKGYFCEHCGGHFSEPVRDSDPDYRAELKDNIFLRLPKTDHPALLGNQNYMQFFESQNGRLRLSSHSHLGLPYKEDNTLFSYGFVYAYFLYLGELAANKFGSSYNSFDKNSKILNIATLGIDNHTAFVASHCGFSALDPTLRPADYFLSNYFFYLVQEKFSTSKRHAIWVKEIDPMQIDQVRLYLASKNCGTAIVNVEHKELNEHIGTTSEWMNEVEQKLERSLPRVTDFSFVHEHFSKIFSVQQRAFSLNTFAPHLAVDAAFEWFTIKNLCETDARYTCWLQGLAILFYPFMPNFCMRLWQKLRSNEPLTLEHFYGN